MGAPYFGEMRGWRGLRRVRADDNERWRCVGNSRNHWGRPCGERGESRLSAYISIDLGLSLGKEKIFLAHAIDGLENFWGKVVTVTYWESGNTAPSPVVNLLVLEEEATDRTIVEICSSRGHPFPSTTPTMLKKFTDGVNSDGGEEVQIVRVVSRRPGNWIFVQDVRPSGLRPQAAAVRPSQASCIMKDTYKRPHSASLHLPLNHILCYAPFLIYCNPSPTF